MKQNKIRKSTNYPVISIVLVIRNEEEKIAECLTHLYQQTYSKDKTELIIVDGVSVDKTRQCIDKFFSENKKFEYKDVRIMDNISGQRCSGLNIGIKAAIGELIIRVDARTVLPEDYIEKCVGTSQRTNAENVGGLQKPLARTFLQEAFAIALTNVFGIGYGRFRVGTKSDYVDTVYLGCFKRTIFDKIGYFDEESPIVSEDSDINQRINDSGGKVYMNSDIIAYYYPRENFIGLAKLYFRYGGAKAGNMIKNRKPTTLRQFGPVIFVLMLLLSSVLCLMNGNFFWIFLLISLPYLTIDMLISLSSALLKKKIFLFFPLIITFPLIHVSYGFGFIYRLLYKPRAGRYWSN